MYILPFLVDVIVGVKKMLGTQSPIFWNPKLGTLGKRAQKWDFGCLVPKIGGKDLYQIISDFVESLFCLS